MPFRRLSLANSSPISRDDDALLSDDVYIAGVQRGDEAIFTALVRGYIDPLTHFAFSFLSDEDAAHDIVQDVFARIWQLGPDWMPNGSVRAYLFIAVRHRALDTLRNTQTRARAHDALRTHVALTAAQVDPYADVALAQRISDGIHALTDRQRDALRLRYGQDQTMPQVAEILGIDVKAAERLVARALTTLRTKLARVQREFP